MLLTLSWRGFIKIQYSSFPLFPLAYPFCIATQSQHYVKRKKCKVNDVIFPSGCEARAISLGNKTMKIGIFTYGTSVRSKNIFTDISRYPTGKHEIKTVIVQSVQVLVGGREINFKSRLKVAKSLCLLLTFYLIFKFVSRENVGKFVSPCYLTFQGQFHNVA